MKGQNMGASADAETGSREPRPSGLGPSGFDPARFEPLPMELWAALPEGRERSLNAIADIIAYWLNYTTRKFADSGMTATPDSHVWLSGYDGAPPAWPSVGQLTRWLLVLRAASADRSGEAGETTQSGAAEGESAVPNGSEADAQTQEPQP